MTVAGGAERAQPRRGGGPVPRRAGNRQAEHPQPLAASAHEPDLTGRLPACQRLLLVPAPVVAEVGYLLGRAGGAGIEAAFLRSIVEHTITVVDLTDADYDRMAALVETYGDFPLGTTDAARWSLWPSDSTSPRSSRWTTATPGPSDRAIPMRSRFYREQDRLGRAT